MHYDNQLVQLIVVWIQQKLLKNTILKWITGGMRLIKLNLHDLLKLETRGSINLDEYYSIKYPGPMFAEDEFLKTVKNAHLLKHNTRLREFPRHSLIKL